MFTQRIPQLLWTLSILIASSIATLVNTNDVMRCSYGERGSLTATCVRADPSYFRSTSYRFDQLDETVKCLNCTLKIIESNTFDISGNMIKNLILKNSRIEMMKPKAFIGLIFLENLDLSFNDIRSIYPGTFTGIKKVKKIDLSDNKINILSDDGFLELINLEELILERNNIKTISSKAFNGLANLSILRMRNNTINEIGNTFSNITSLKVLDLENNQISNLSGTEFENLTSLLELNLANNRIQVPSLQINPGNKLRFLFLSFNNIKNLKADFFKSLHNLELLDLSYNYIENIDHKVLQNLFSLHSLNISHNALETIYTGVFTGIPQLEILNVSHNKISNIVITGVFSLESLHSLDISNNKLRDFDYPGLISRVPRLTYLKMDNNLLPCDLEKEMEEYFQEDNFKFSFYEPVVGSVKCLDTPYVKPRKLAENLIREVEPAPKVGGLEIFIIILICLIMFSVGYLYYLQYQTYNGLKITPSRRTVSSVNLVDPENDGKQF